ncbi:tetratricopeptide repeat protein [Stakelama marina]|uniref:Tetratricopeptide repeat protein n=1 Tax=Stakelama marina TaxID=2826939 RepID=A0A8T4IAX8_9SPHN|nr:tetratricopeptide repeat protein [Stakelama marina]MBR0552178.1 tetratricopeptide repeat protein [Stakelama marina]
MALSPESNEAFFREVDEEMRRDQLTEFGRRWGKWIAVLIVVVIVAVGGWMYWHTHNQSTAEQRGEKFDTALEALAADNSDKAQKPLAELAQSDSEGYRAMATFAQADALLKKDDDKGAAKKFAAIANDQSLAKPYRDLATIRQTAVEFDTLKPDAIIQRLRALANKQSPWFGSAGEMVALAYLRANRPDLASKMFSDIAAADNVPESIRQRAVQMAGVLDTEAAAQKKGAGKQSDGDANTKEKTAG